MSTDSTGDRQAVWPGDIPTPLAPFAVPGASILLDFISCVPGR